MRDKTIIYALLFFSGSAGLAYQTIWTKMFAVALGHEIPSLFAVVAAFFAGLAAGSFFMHARINRSARPEIWYAGLELVIGLWSLLILFGQPYLGELIVALLDIDATAIQHWSLAFGLSMLFMMPATFAMGATLPAMEQAIARRFPNDPAVGKAYALNTLGAVLGVLAGTFWLLPKVGQETSLLIFVAINLVCAAAAGLLIKDHDSGESPAGFASKRSLVTSESAPHSILGARYGTEAYLGRVLFFTGLLGIAYEIVCVRLMSQVFEGTLYSFATALAVYLVFSSFGAMVQSRYAARNPQALPLQRLPDLLNALALSCLAGLITLYFVRPVYRGLRVMLGDGFGAVFIAELSIALVVFLLPTFLMGATFSLLAQAHRDIHRGMGRAMAINTFGGSMAPILFGLLLLPLAGAKWTLGVVATSYLLLGAASKRQGALLAVFMAVLLAIPPLHIVSLRDGQELVVYKEGVAASSAVVGSGEYRNLRVNNRYIMGGTAPEVLLFQKRQTHIPLLLHAEPEDVLFLGVASGVTVGAAIEHPKLQVDAVELVPEVLDLLEYFSPANNAPQDHPRVRLFAADARRYVRTVEKQYDVIIADLFHPGRDGAGLLFTHEHYAAIKERIAEGGIFCHWLPFHQLDSDMIAVITRTFLDVFPDARLVLASNDLRTPALGLITGVDTGSMRPGYLAERVASVSLRRELVDVFMRSDLELFSTLLLDTDALLEVAGAAPINRDMFPIVSYQAPKFTYQLSRQNYERMMDLVDRFDERIGVAVPRENYAVRFARELKQYSIARNRYLQGVLLWGKGDERNAVEAYFTSLQASPEFERSYLQLLQIATNKMDSGAESSVQVINPVKILKRLYEIYPSSAVENLLDSE